MPLDVCNSGLGSYAGLPMKFAGMCMSVLPNGTALGKRGENFPIPSAQLSPSGLEQKLTNRFDDITYYAN